MPYEGWRPSLCLRRIGPDPGLCESAARRAAGRERDPKRPCRSRARPISTVSSSGRRTVCFSAAFSLPSTDSGAAASPSSGCVELRVHNYAQGGSVNAVSLPAPGFWRRARRALVGVADHTAPRPVTVAASGMRALAFTQVLLAVVLIGLVADRLTGWMTPVQPAAARDTDRSSLGGPACRS